MRKLLNVLYVTSPDSYIACERENVVVRVQDREAFRIPVHNLEGIVTFGYAGVSPALIRLCCERGVAVSFLKENGEFLGRVHGPVSGNVLLRRKQYRIADDAAGVKLAKRFIFAKIANCRAVLHRALRDHADELDEPLVRQTVRSLQSLLRLTLGAGDCDELRGLEGDAARKYFSAFQQLILHEKTFFRMNGRSRRPPLDPVNAMLSFCYTLLVHEVQAALESVGLDPAVGFLHRDRPGRPGLALDLMEELRPYLADRLVLSLINRRQIAPKGFRTQENGMVVMTADTRKQLITAWQKRKQEEIRHPYLNEKIPVGLLPYVQALLLARHLRGDLAEYPPFLWK